MTLHSDVENCLSIIKQFLLCPICLDDCRNPVITPCAHKFCKFCIEQHLSQKRQAKCPICNRNFTRRSLKVSEKITLIVQGCEAVISTYESDAHTTLIPTNLPSSYLHLSQELTQRPVIQDGSTAQESSSSRKIPAGKSTVSPPCKAKKPRSRILLGTSARNKRTGRKSLPLPTASDDELLTQPMLNSNSNHVKPAADPCPKRTNEELCDLFTLTQLTQPMENSFEFSAVEGMRGFPPEKELKTLDRRSGPSACDPTDSPQTDRDNPKPPNIRTVPSLPPLPPSDVQTKKTKKSGSRSESSKAHIIFRKRRQLSSSALSDLPVKRVTKENSAHAILTKTHEVICRVQSSLSRLGSSESIGPHSTSRISTSIITETSSVGRSLKRQPSASYSVRSWPMKHATTPKSIEARNRLLKKYGLTRRSVFPPAPSGSYLSLKSPGWSRWRSMYRDLKRRSSTFRLRFRSLSASREDFQDQLRTNVPPSTETSVMGNKPKLGHKKRKTISILPKNSGSILRRSKRIKNSQSAECRLSDAVVGAPGSPESLFSRPMKAPSLANFPSRQSKEPCKFVLPLHRLLSSDRLKEFSSSIPKLNNFLADSKMPQSDAVTSTTAKTFELPVHQPLVSPAGLSRESICSNGTDDLLRLPSALWCQQLHCNVCGATQLTPASSRRSSNLSSLHVPDISCSLSSNYWQAEDPGDTLFTECTLDHLVNINRPFLAPHKAFNDIGCQTGDAERTPSKSHVCSQVARIVTGDAVPHTVTNTREPSDREAETCSADQIQEKGKNAPPQPCVTLSPLKSPNKLMVNSDKTSEQAGPVGSPDAVMTVQASCSEIMPTVDRERLMHECNQLEAVVAALQQQLEAQAGEMSPQSAEELLRAAGTEPADDDFDMGLVKGSGNSDRSNSQHKDNDLRVQPELTVSSTVVPGQQEQENPPLVSDPAPNIASEGCVLDAVDVIPSSQLDEDNDSPTLAPVRSTVQALPISTSKVAALNRVEPSQPPSSFSAIMSEIIPPTLLSAGSEDKGQNEQPTLHPLSLETEITQCPETNMISQSPSVNTDVPSNVSHSRIASRAIAVTGSNLSGNEIALVHQFCKRFGLSEHSRFIPGQTTHIVMMEEPDRPRVVKRTLKYFMGILNRAWIVNTEWIRRSLAANEVVDESPYEIEGDTVCGDCHEGPRRGRLNVPAQPQLASRSKLALSSHLGLPGAVTSDHRPFAGLWLCAFGSLGLLTLPDFISLAVDGGAQRVFENPEELALAADTFVKARSGQLVGVSRPKAIILTNNSSPHFSVTKCQDLYQLYGIPVISVDWMLNCISLYRRIPISQAYRICPAPQQIPGSGRQVR
ncbi:unnamed protein product [Calicophoron daubneyi]|uniref:RING-type E3 ubiquitin transferase BRCA1 n=1 Tax=Calicophoron daubneyi TaxID=300641 RepID=A0AAV2T4Z3_CALDB